MRSPAIPSLILGRRFSVSFTAIHSLSRRSSAVGFSTSSEILRDVRQPNSVQRDLSPVADETRAAMEATMKMMFDLSNGLAFLGLSQLGFGAWAYYYYAIPAACWWSSASPLIAAMGCTSVGLPISLSCMLRRRLRAMFFLKRMEEEGRLDILAMNLRAARNMDRLFVELRPVSCICIGGGFLLGGLCSKAAV
ncbi:hypothetical protein SAY87_010182 [Trapa incisa]|uniref:Transmembrane protein n=1 Tax=Trapa incisa TaxID=236973 RepID=A0AAN7GDT4_9MYRT|nr:hypothetical protein SAY87_010182 [Trapa incisa]